MRPLFLAYYLPQYHPFPENDEWWGKGFTEWTNVAKATPLFKGHVQPHVPADLGFYDLRLSEPREEQAKLAKDYGVSAFCYWHYWFGNGKQLLEKPLQQVVASGKPDFPFCLGWANHPWEKKIWNKDVSRFNHDLLIDQEYPGESDYEDHFNTMLTTFKDERYFKVNGKLVFIIYAVKHIPDVCNFMNLWQNLAKKNGLPGFYFIATASNQDMIDYAFNSNVDAVVYENLHDAITRMSTNRHRIQNLVSTILNRPLSVLSYTKFIEKLDYDVILTNDRIFPSIYPNWDTSPRRGVCGDILTGATPNLFKTHVLKVLRMLKGRKSEDQIVFLKSWNEWAEGNYIEPDLEYGKGRLEALRDAIKESE